MGNIKDELKELKVTKQHKGIRFEELIDHHKMLEVEMTCLRTNFLTESCECYDNLKNVKDILVKIEGLIKECYNNIPKEQRVKR